MASRASEPAFEEACSRFDAANSEDPNQEIEGGRAVARELLYGQRMTSWLGRLYPDAGEALRLAARAQHLCRWRLPRQRFAEGRQGYLEWRTSCAKMHAELAGEILRQVGYDETFIARVASLQRKEGLAEDEEVQALEDTACLVFLENHFADLAKSQEDARMLRILKRTWKKMSLRAQGAARELELPDDLSSLLRQAVGDATTSVGGGVGQC